VSEDMTPCTHCGDYHPNCTALGYCPAQLDDQEDAMVYLPLPLATGQMSTCPVCFFDDGGVTPCPEHLAELCEGCCKPLNGEASPCAECAKNAW
jgi:hypothetical protein